jgi:hypothetical protein
MNVVKLDSGSVAEWRGFCNTEPDATFWHQDSYVDYMLNHMTDHKSAQLSFMVEQDGRAIALCPLILENNGATESLPARKELSFSGSFGPMPVVSSSVSARVAKRAMSLVFSEIDSLAVSNGAVRTSMRDMPLKFSFFSDSLAPSNQLSRFGYQDASISTLLIDLNLSEAELLKAMSKGHRSAIRAASNTLDVEVFSGPDTTRAVFDEYVKIHALAAGRVTRPANTFDNMYNWIVAGNAGLSVASEDGKYVGFSLFFLTRGGAYYASACNVPGRRDLPVAHVNQWGTIRWLKEHGYRFYETGWQQYGPQHHGVPSEKELSIELFKRGFGGDVVPLFRGEKYYDAEFYRSVMNARTEQVASTIELPAL